MKLFLLVICCCVRLSAPAQTSYRLGDTISDFKINRIINSSITAGSFKSLSKDISIIDFFGTWCVPCIKALPRLESLQTKYSTQLSIILMSIEKEAQLSKFIAARKTFKFSVAVDADNSLSNLFQPPSYPYTLVINRAGQIIAITEASTITDEKINQWLLQQPAGQKNDPVKTPLPQPVNLKSMETSDNNPVTELSQQFIYAAKTGSETSALETKLQELNFEYLQKNLITDDDKKSFWINMYNGFTQLLLKKDPGQYKKRNKFFKLRQIMIAGKTFSLDEIEHDILRRSKIKWSLGYFTKLFAGKKAKALRVNTLDYRIHFALNCGAKSCPPIAFYESGKISAQLDMAARSYLTSEAQYNPDKNTLHLPAIMGWFRRDFKGKKNMLLLVKKYGLVPEEKKPRISFNKYNWNLYLDNYKN